MDVPGTVNTSENARTEKDAPLLVDARSATFSRHVALASSPLNTESGELGWKVPDHGAPPETIDWMALLPESSSTVWQKLFPPLPVPPGRFISTTETGEPEVGI